MAKSRKNNNKNIELPVENSADKKKRLEELMAKVGKNSIDKETEIAERLSELYERMKEVEGLEATIKQEYEEKEASLLAEHEELREYKKKLEKEIKDDEVNIRKEVAEKEKRKLLAELKVIEAEAEVRRKEIISEAEKYRDEAYQKLCDTELDKKAIIDQARDEALNRIREAEEKSNKIMDEAENNSEIIKAQIKELKQNLAVEKQKIESERERLDADLEDLEFREEDLKELKDIYQEKIKKCSEGSVANLEIKLASDREKIELLQKESHELLAQIRTLEKYAPAEGSSRTLSDILQELEIEKNKNQKLKDQLADAPGDAELINLRRIASDYEIIKEQLVTEKSKRVQAERMVEVSGAASAELENNREILRTYKILNEQLRQEMERTNNLYKQETTGRFKGLLEIDKNYGQVDVREIRNDIASLSELVDYIRAYGAIYGDGRNKLYYSHKTIRLFIASLASSKLIILQGLSGTGKSSLPRLFEYAMGVGNYEIPVQSSWRDNRELLGYDNDFTRIFKETAFTKAIYTASLKANEQKINFVVLDEMNLSRVEYYFANFLSVMERTPDKWYVQLVDSNDDICKPKNLREGTDLHITPNIWFIGTANRDESTLGITDKVYDRAQVIDFMEREEEFDLSYDISRKSMNFNMFNNLIEKAQKDKNNQMTADDWGNIDLIDDLLKEKLEITFGNRIKMQIKNFIPVYVACGGTKLEALDYIFAHKVLRKLENRFESYVAKILEEVNDFIISTYGEDNFVESRRVIKDKIEKLK